MVEMLPTLKLSRSEVYDNLNEIMPTNCRQIPLPTNEHQVRYIAKARLKPEMQLEVWRTAVELAKGKVPSGRIVKNVVRRIKAKPIPISFRQGEICRLIAKDNPEPSGKRRLLVYRDRTVRIQLSGQYLGWGIYS